jgi:hypothetical protein
MPQNNDLYKILHFYYTVPTNLEIEGHTIRICTKYYRANLSLGGTIRNVMPQIFETHPTSKQHRTHINKSFYFIIYQKVT